MKEILTQIRVSLILGLMTILPAGLMAQQGDSSYHDRNYILQTDAWLLSGRAAGIQFLPTSFSSAELTANLSRGGLVNFFESDHSFTWTAQTESYRRISPKTVVQGGIAYENFQGKNMGASALIDPYQYPLDLDESSDTTGGDKTLERYHILGALSTQLAPRWFLGGKMDLEAANYAKQKDLRHVNKLLDLKASTGFLFRPSNKLELGLDYRYSRRIESIYFNTYGNTDRQYLTLINFGGFFGKNELFDGSGSGYTTSGTQPMIDHRHAVALQASYRPSADIQIFQDFSFTSRSGYYGDKGSTSVVFTEHSGAILGYQGSLVVDRGILHRLDISASLENLANQENIYRRETTPGGNTNVVYYGQREILDRQLIEAQLDYHVYMNPDRSLPHWVLGLSAKLWQRSQTASLFPYYRRQDISNLQYRLSGQKEIPFQDYQFSISGALTFSHGFGTIAQDGLYSTPSSDQGAPKTQNTYLHREYEYFTSPRPGGELGFKAAKKLPRAKMAYIRTLCTLEYAGETSYLSHRRGIASLSLGYNF